MVEGSGSLLINNQKGYPGSSISLDVCLSASRDLVLASPSVQWLCRLESLAGDLEQVAARRSALSLLLLEAFSTILCWPNANPSDQVPTLCMLHVQ